MTKMVGARINSNLAKTVKEVCVKEKIAKQVAMEKAFSLWIRFKTLTKSRRKYKSYMTKMVSARINSNLAKIVKEVCAKEEITQQVAMEEAFSLWIRFKTLEKCRRKYKRLQKS